jgi:hypothetical protein
MVMWWIAGLALIAAPASDTIDRAQGGIVKSPDGRWEILSQRESGGAWLRAKGNKGMGRRLTSFERSLKVIWPGGNKVMLVGIGGHYSALSVFPITGGKGQPDALQRDIDRQMAEKKPAIAILENRRMAFGKVGSAPCALIEESGVQRGRGKTAALRRASFRLDLKGMRAVAIKNCPGAAL